MHYRREVDGLRAVAVLPVILYHAGFSWFSGGYVGVDVFFVISGYLITSLLLDEIENGTFSIARFYERRARRILPALFFVVICCIPFAWMWMLPPQFKDFSQALIGVSLFASNFVFWKQSGYFAPPSEENPLIHTWSLGVEEQFYIVFPVLLLLLLRFGRRPAFYALTAVTAFSLLLAEYGWPRDASARFYLIPTRAWELGVGALCAFFMYGKPQKESSLLACVGLGMIALSVVVFDQTTPFPSVYALLPVLGTALVVAFAGPGTMAAKLLSFRWLVGLGIISYSLYLWHQPLFAFTRLVSLKAPEWEVMAALSMLSIVLAYFTYRYIETPFRKRRGALLLATKQHVFATSSIAALVLLAVGAYGSINDGVEARFEKGFYQIIRARKDLTNLWKCQAWIGEVPAPEDACVLGNDNNVVAALIGDSHATVLSEQLSLLAEKHGFGITMLTKAGCAPAVGLKRSMSDCPEFNSSNSEYIQSAGYDYVIVGARWALYYLGTGYDNGEGGVEYHEDAKAWPVDKKVASEKVREKEVLQHYKDTIESYLSSGINVVLLWDIPEAGWDVPQYLSKVYRLKRSVGPADASTSYRAYQERTERIQALFSSIDDSEYPGRLINIRPSEYFCNTKIQGRCITHDQGVPFYIDDSHLSNHGASPLAARIAQTISGALSKQVGYNRDQ